MKSYRKPYKVKRKKPIWRSWLFRLGILALIVFGAISYLLFFSGIFQIEKVIVTGQERVAKEDIKSLVPQKNIFLIDSQSIRKEILSYFPQIAEVEIHRGFPDTLNILVIERLALAIWCEEDGCFLVDAEGVIFEEASAETDLIKIVGAKEIISKEKIAQISEIQTKLEERLAVTATEAFIDSEERINIKTSEGWETYFNLKGDLDWQIQELGLVLEKQIPPEKRGKLEYVDLRFSRVYYKYRE